MSDHVKVEIDAGVMTLTLARPEKKNALSNAMYGVLADSLEAAEKDPAVRVVILQADGDSFTAGNDLQDFAAQATGAFAGERHVLRFLKALANATRPLVAAVQGQAVGVGTTMLLHCDLVYVTPDARLTTPFVNLALVPEAASSWLLPARIGHARAYAMFALGEAIDGGTAVAWGIANGSAEARRPTGPRPRRRRPVGDQAAGRPDRHQAPDARRREDRRLDGHRRRGIRRPPADGRGARSLHGLRMERRRAPDFTKVS
jgi:enoyl-CoA hydratase/carnithine racemase